ncbi:MAG: response regulator [Anaerolineae bacterium]
MRDELRDELRSRRGSRSIRVLLADDHAVLRAGLHLLLNAQPDMEVVGEAVNSQEAIEKAQQLQPDVVLLDITMPGTSTGSVEPRSGLEAVREIRERAPEVKVLILTMHDDEGYLRQALKAGAWGYVPKKAADTELLSAIHAVQRGEIFIYPSLTKGLVEDLLPKEVEDRTEGLDGYDLLSQREKEVLRLVALGHTNQQIADMLFISVKTVETYRARVMEKLDLHNRAELVRYAIQKGLLINEV